MPLWKKVQPGRSSRPKSILTGHDGSAELLAIALDGTWLATAGTDRLVRIWDPATGEHRHFLPGRAADAVLRLAVSPDGTRLASADRNGIIEIHDPTLAFPGRTMHTSSPPQILTWLPGTTTVAAGNTETLHLFHLPHP